MKSRYLRFRFFVLFLGFITLNSLSFSFAGNPGGVKLSQDRMQQIRANQHTGTISANDMLKAQAQVNIMSADKSTSDVNLNWSQLGPNNAAGRTRTVLFTNKDASGQTILTGGVTGGIWKSRNMGLTWHQMDTQDNTVLRVTSMVQNSSGRIYVATGESYCNNNQYIGTGIYISDDDSIFTVLPSTQPVANDPTSDWSYVSRLALNIQTGTIFAATNTGLKYSTDEGTTWTTALTGNAYTVIVGADGTVLANVDNLAYISSGTIPLSFTNLSTATPTTFPNVGVTGIEFAIAPSDQNTIYASLVNTAGGLLNLYKSSDKGNTWSVVFPGNSTYVPLVNGCYANSIAVLPSDPNQVYLGGANIWHGKQYQTTGYYNWEQVSQIGIDESSYESDYRLVPSFQHQLVFNPVMTDHFVIATDDGVSMGTISSDVVVFKHLIKNCIISQFNSVACSMTKPASFGGAEYIGAISIPGTGLNEPENGVQVYPGYGGDVAWSMIFPTSIYYASGDLYSQTQPFIRSEDFGVTPSPTFMSVITNPNYAAINYWESFNFTESADSIIFIVKTGPIAKDSTFDVLSSNEKFPIHYTAPKDYAVNDTIKVQDVVQTRFFITGTSNNAQGIFMTKQALQYTVDPVWFRIGDLLPTDVVTCITVSKDLSVLWAGTKSGNLYRLTNVTHANDSTTAFADSAGCVVGHMLYDSTIYAQFNGRDITSIALSPDNKTVLVTLGNYGNTDYIYKTTNGLDPIPTFVSAQGNLPAMPVYTGILEMSNPDIAILGTDFGVFSTSSISAGSTIWTEQNTGTGNVPVTKIIQQTNPGLYYYRPENYGDLYMASFGRGLFFDNSFGVVLGTDPINSKPAEVNKLKIQPNPFNNDVYISYKLGKTAPVNISVYDLSGRSVYTTSFGTQQTGEYIKTLNLGSLSNGTYIIKLDYGTGSLFGKAMKVN
jgi:hypothetical protein